MKKRIIMVFVTSMVSFSSFACDICGCGAGGSYIGILPEFRKRFFGVRYQQNSMVTHLGPGGMNTYLTATETFRVAEFWGATNIGKKFRVTAFVPWNFISRNGQQAAGSDNGIGDITAIGYYQLLDKNKTTAHDKLLVQSLWIGAGAKLPTGKYNAADKNVQASAPNTFQLGTGSVDFSLHTMYDIRLQDAGINTNASYKITTANSSGYRYGNKFTLNTLAYYKFRIAEKIMLAPNAGVMYETAAKDKKTKDIRVWETGGHSLMGTAGLEMSFGKFSLGLNFQTPLSQHLGEGKVKARERGMIHFSLAI